VLNPHEVDLGLKAWKLIRELLLPIFERLVSSLEPLDRQAAVHVEAVEPVHFGFEPRPFLCEGGDERPLFLNRLVALLKVAGDLLR